VQQVNELQMISVEFNEFFRFGAIYSTAVSQMFTLFNVSCSTLYLGDWDGVFVLPFVDFYSDGFTFTNCAAAGLITLQSTGDRHRHFSFQFQIGSLSGLKRCVIH
jgi:hypothetical protein